MSNKLVLITGSNGAIGYEVVLHALRAGYRVRAVVRTQAKADLISDNAAIQRFRSKIAFVVVPDLLKPTAYDEVIQGVDFVIHVASPIPKGKSNDLEIDIVQPAVAGTMNMLEAAEKTPSVKRVVITSSVVAQTTFEEFALKPILGTYTEETRVANPVGPYLNEGQAYIASKVRALNTAENWKREGKRVEIVHVHPSIVLGRMDLVERPEEILHGSSTARALAQILGRDGIATPEIVSATCWIEDVAEVHVRALEDDVPDGQSLAVVADGPNGIRWEEGKDIVAKAFPDAVRSGKFSNKEWSKTKNWRYDVSVTEKLVGMKFAGFEKQITEVGRQYLEREW